MYVNGTDVGEESEVHRYARNKLSNQNKITISAILVIRVEERYSLELWVSSKTYGLTTVSDRRSRENGRTIDVNSMAGVRILDL